MSLLKIRYIALWTILLLTLNISTIIASESHNTTFEKGVKAFKQREYKKAAEFFETTHKAGFESSALCYNLGVTYFKLRRYSEARDKFELLANYPDLAPLAHYNLGLIALRTGDKSTASKHFHITARTAEDNKLRMLARSQLKKPEPKTRKIWSGFFSIAAGYDDNVALNVDDTVEVSDIKDNFVEFIGNITSQLTGTKKNGLQFSSTVYSQRYQDAEEFNFDNLRIGPEIDRRIGAWDTTLRGFVDWAFIDGDLFENILNAEISGRRNIHSNINLRLRYRLSRIDASSIYESQTGTRHRLSAEVRTNILDAYTRLGYTLELNNRDDVSFPLRHNFYFSTDFDYMDVWHTEVTAQYRYSNYKHISRNDNRLWLTYKLSRDILWKLRLYGKYDFIKNSSNNTQRDYTSNIISIGIERLF